MVGLSDIPEVYYIRNVHTYLDLSSSGSSGRSSSSSSTITNIRGSSSIVRFWHLQDSRNVQSLSHAVDLLLICYIGKHIDEVLESATALR